MALMLGGPMHGRALLVGDAPAPRLRVPAREPRPPLDARPGLSLSTNFETSEYVLRQVVLREFAQSTAYMIYFGPGGYLDEHAVRLIGDKRVTGVPAYPDN